MLCRGGAVIQQTGILFFTLYLYFVCDYQWELVFSPLDCTCSTLPSPCTFLHAPLALWADVFWPVVTDPTNLLTFYCLLSPGSSLTLRFQVHSLTSFLFLFFYFFSPVLLKFFPHFCKVLPQRCLLATQQTPFVWKLYLLSHMCYFTVWIPFSSKLYKTVMMYFFSIPLIPTSWLNSNFCPLEVVTQSKIRWHKEHIGAGTLVNTLLLVVGFPMLIKDNYSVNRGVFVVCF